ncbi:MAG: lipoprotein, partial [Flavobacteriales bacterium]|nr:lipoprotein [Flavobacteriales bacterium]
MKKLIFFIVGLFLLSACSSKRNITYLNGVNEYANTDISKHKTPYIIQEDDILRIDIRSMVPEAAIVYNKIPQNTNTSTNLNLLQLEGYLVSSDYSINFPVLGTLDVKGSTLELEKKITKLLLEGGH